MRQIKQKVNEGFLEYLFLPIRVISVHLWLTSLAISRYLQNAFANSICRGVLHCTSNNAELATSTVTHCAREGATWSRLALEKLHASRTRLQELAWSLNRRHRCFLTQRLIYNSDAYFG